MPKVGREVKDRRMGKVKLKKSCFCHISCRFFWQFLNFSQSEPLVIEINDEKVTTLTDIFAICLPSFYTDHYLKLKFNKRHRVQDAK